MMTPKNKPLALVLCLALGGCSTVNPPTFLSYIQPKAGAKGATAPNPVATPTDAVALKYANEIEVMYRRNATGARITREGSDTGLAGIAAVTGAAKSLAIGASGLSSLGLASGGIVALRTIFDAKGRSTAYEEAAERIHGAIKDYVAHNLNDVPSDKLTPNGWTLANVVQSNIDIVNKILNGHLPTPEALQQASEPMSDNGASPQPTGSTPRNNIPQAGPLGNARGRYEGPLSGGIVSVPDRPAPEVDSVKMANQLRGNIRDLSEPGAQAMIEAARHYEVLNPVFTEQPQGTTPARRYLFHLIDVAAHKKDDHAQLKAWRAIIPVRPAAQDAPVL